MYECLVWQQGGRGERRGYTLDEAFYHWNTWEWAAQTNVNQRETLSKEIKLWVILLHDSEQQFIILHLFLLKLDSVPESVLQLCSGPVQFYPADTFSLLTLIHTPLPKIFSKP